MAAYDFPLLLKHILTHGVGWAPDQEIIYRGQVRLTYSAMYQRVLRLGGALRALGVAKGSKVGVIEWDSHRYLEMYFGIPGIGAILHTINPRLAPEDLVYTVAHAEDEVLIFHEDFLPLVERLRPRATTIRKYILLTDKPEKPDIPWIDAEYEALLAGATPLLELPDLDENTIATTSYTTGTTGQPKGVYFTQRQLSLHTLCGGVALMGFGNHGGVDKHDVYMPLTPMFHVHAWGVPYLMTMLGVKQVYPGKYEPEILMKLLVGEKVTFSHCVPTILQMIVSAPVAQKVDLSRWKVIIGGARLPRGLAGAAAKLGVKVWSGYGMSETCPILTLAHLKPYMEDWDEERQLDMAVKTGVPIPFVNLKVVDTAGQEVPRDGKETGEIIVRSPWLTPGYYKEPERSEQLWEGGWLHTGDVAVVDGQGYIQIVDRLKDVIKSGGEWIVSLELENILSLHEGVAEAAVIGMPDEKWGERPLAIVVPRQEFKDKLTAEDLKTHVTRYAVEGVITDWSVPDNYMFVDEIPKTSVGKIDKKVLRSRYLPTA
jgi:fatty-acyl-CoA synthase